MLVYDPPQRVVFSWDIGPTWQVEPENTSEVEVRFIAEDPHRTRVELEHRHLDRHGPGREAVRDGIAHDQDWPRYLDRYAALPSSAAVVDPYSRRLSTAADGRVTLVEFLDLGCGPPPTRR